jgi:hypothetical protein
MEEKIGLPIRKLLNILRFTQLWVKPKPENFCLPDWTPNTMSPYCDTTSNNSSPERRGGATSFSTLPTKKSFYSFCTCGYVARNDGDGKKRSFTPVC